MPRMMPALTLASCVILALLQGGCSERDTNRGSISYDALPDPSIDLEPIEIGALANDDCATLLRLMNALAETGDASVVKYVNQSLS